MGSQQCFAGPPSLHGWLTHSWPGFSQSQSICYEGLCLAQQEDNKSTSPKVVSAMGKAICRSPSNQSGCVCAPLGTEVWMGHGP